MNTITDLTKGDIVKFKFKTGQEGYAIFVRAAYDVNGLSCARAIRIADDERLGKGIRDFESSVYHNKHTGFHKMSWEDLGDKVGSVCDLHMAWNYGNRGIG